MNDLLTQTLSPSTIEYPENPADDLIVWADDESWCFLDETSKLAPNTVACPFAVNMDGIVALADMDTLPSTLSLFAMDCQYRQQFLWKQR